MQEPRTSATENATMAEAVKTSSEEGVVVESGGERLTLQPPPAGRSRAEPVASHWRQDRRLSDVIDSGVPSPWGSPRVFFGAPPSPLSPLAPGPYLPPHGQASSLPKDLTGAYPRSPRSPLAPVSPASDRGYSGSAFSSPLSPAAPAAAAAALGSPAAPVPAAPAPAGPARDALDAGVAQPAVPADDYVWPMGKPHNEAPMFVEKHADEYNMNHPRRGRAIIINNDLFATTTGFAPRSGSEQDVKNLETAFASLDFEVKIHHNKTYLELIKIIEELAKEDHTDADCLVVTVLTHGIAGGYLLSKDVPYQLQHVWHPFTPDQCPTLAGKPKLFFVQACRGEGLDRGVTVTRRTQTDSGNQSYKIPTHADFLIAYSASEGNFSWRHPEDGTWFIQCLSDELKRNGNTMELLRLLTRVSRRVAVDFESSHDNPWMHQCKQVPQFTSMLLRDVFFRPKE